MSDRIGFAVLLASLSSCGTGPDDAQDLAAYPQAISLAKDLAEARRATAVYHDFDAALADGYVNTGLPCSPGAGFHYIKLPLIGSLDRTKPALLLYREQDGEMQLVALEWLSPISDPANPSPPPEMFGEPLMGPYSIGDFYFYALHVWAWLNNPNGLFEPFNSLVECN